MSGKQTVGLVLAVTAPFALLIGGLCGFIYLSVQSGQRHEGVLRARRAEAQELTQALRAIGGKVDRDRTRSRPDFSRIVFHDGPQDEQDLAILQRIPQLEELALMGSDITGAGLVHLRGLPNLRSLQIGRKISDAGLAHVGHLTCLEVLCLVSSEVTDAGLAHLKPLTQLERLELSCPNLTDTGLQHLECLPNLKYLDLELTPLSFVTDHGIQRLKQKLPTLTVVVHR